ncbi:uncharacterized protein (DUF2249 family) [Planifilum fimeticola]|uniref:Uncharacterized protein (DUF2249 family) n=1 Tax=Planifilum fimeticola TaxID=201975 RepID=A0A2T0LIX7_9BACL|nr:DUF2249 domain-containing protein [Planifilum fimeticola]PRX42401.1 uncharacterized protein (DUF2249 family) [Planifilum fimeticola]
MKEFAATIKVTEYPPHLKHRVIFETFDQLKPGEALLLINDHNPIPLRYQFESMYPDGFTWEYLEEGPEVFQVKIGKK